MFLDVLLRKLHRAFSRKGREKDNNIVEEAGIVSMKDFHPPANVTRIRTRGRNDVEDEDVIT